MARAGYDMRIATVDSRCGGCGADISQGAEYGYDSIAMKICEGCIEVFEDEEKERSYEVEIQFTGWATKTVTVTANDEAGAITIAEGIARELGSDDLQWVLDDSPYGFDIEEG